jgi:teichuronic acid biosynthesis glycosyltransferase TuaG
MILAHDDLISIITPAYNSEGTLAETIQSVLAQTYPYWEMLVVDDQSSDGTLALAKSFAEKDQRIKVLQSPKNLGCAGARNVALEEAKGRFVCFLDADDLWLENKLESQLGFTKTNGAALSYTCFRCISADGKEVGPVVPIPEFLDYEELLKQNRIATLTTMIDTEKTGPVRMTLAPRDDFILWLSIAKQGLLVMGIIQDLARYRLMPGSVSSSKIWSARKVWTLFRQSQNMSRTEALYYYAQYAVRSTYKHLVYYRVSR